MRIRKGGVAFFDSGIGGLTVLSECQKTQGKEIFYYYGDNQRAPYGNLPPKKIKRYVFQAFRQFKRLKVKAVVLACNTATAVCVEDLRKKYSFPIIGAEPAVRLGASAGGRVLVLATRATSKSERLRALCEKVGKEFPDAEFCIRPCDELAGAIEQNLLRKDYDYTLFLPDEKADAVVLGCTHYIYIVEQIRRFYRCPIFEGNAGIARRLCAVLGDGRDDCTSLTTDRDCRPLDGKKDAKVGLLTTKSEKVCDCQILSNKRSQKMRPKDRKTCSGGNVFFLGKQRKNNENIYKQMFVSTISK
jgi:glutamate racemase